MDEEKSEFESYVYLQKADVDSWSQLLATIYRQRPCSTMRCIELGLTKMKTGANIRDALHQKPLRMNLLDG